MESEQGNSRQSQLVRWRSEGAAMVAAWEASGLSMRAYAQQAGISERRLGLWRRRLAKGLADQTPARAPDSGFVPVTTIDASSTGLAVIIDEHIRIAVTASTDLALLQQTVAALRC